jgi:hypothetical protein
LSGQVSCPCVGVRSAALHEPHLLTVPVPPGDTVRGWLTYDNLAGTTPHRLQGSPTRPDGPRADATSLLSLP